MKRSFWNIVSRNLSPTAAGLVLTAFILFGTQIASADGTGNADVLEEQACMQDTASFGLGCTANDVSLATATNITILDDGCQFPGDEVTFTADFEVQLTAQARHDVGIWFASDGDGNGDGALTGQCTAVTPAYAPDPPWLDLDGTNDDPDGVIQDTCGDIDAAHNPLFPSVTLTVACIDPDGDGLLNLPYCTSWRQPGSNELCTSPLQAFPGAPSKCKCDTGFTLDIPVPFSGTVEVIKELVPAESPGAFNLQVDGVDQATDAGHLGSTGPVTVSAGISTDPEPIGDTHTVGETAGTGTDLADFDTTISCEDQGNDTASGSDTGPVDLFVEPDDAWVCTITNTLRNTDLAISKSDDPDPVAAGATLTYTITVDNLGLIDAENVVVTESLPAGVSFDSTSGCAEDPNGVPTCSLGTISAGGSAGYTVTVTVNGDVPDQTVLTNSVAVSSDTPDENPTNDTATEDTTVLNNPALSIVKTASPSTYDSVGDVISYSYLVTNTGNVTITSLAVTDDNVDAAATCNDSTLAPQGSTTCSAQRTATQTDIDAGSITNVAFASGTAPSGSPVNSPNDDETVTAIQTPALSIVKTASPSTYDGVGDVISYSYLVTNDGNVTITSLAVTDDNVDAPATCLTDTLAPQGSTTCSAQRTVTQTDIDAGSITNIAFASGTDPNGGGVTSPNDDETVTAVQTPALSIVKTASPSTYDSVGDVISYSYLVTNDGNVTITSLAVTDDNVDAPATCLTDTLAPQGSTTCSAQRTVTQTDIDAGSITNVAFASGTDPNGGDVNSPNDDETVTAVQTPALSIVKTASPSTYDSVGDVISYSYLVSNDGNVTITSLAVTDDNVDAPATCLTDTLAPQGSTTCSAQRTVTQTDIDAGSITNIAFASGTDPNGGDVNSPNDDETVTAVQTPALSIVKTASPSTYDSVGDVISYSYLVSNDGNVTITSLAVTDDNIDASATCNDSTLAPQGSTTCSAQRTVTQTDIDAGSITNIAFASGTDPNGGDVNSPNDDETVTAVQTPALSIVKTASPSTYDSVGDVISYSYLVTNDGNVTITSLAVTDDNVDASATCNDSTLAPQGSTTCSAQRTVTQTDIDAGSITNIAFASGTDPNGGPVNSPNDDETVTAVQTPALSIVKTASPSTYDSVGDVISYSYLVSNDGNVTITSLAVTDDNIDASATCNDSTLAPQGSTTCSAQRTVTQTDIDAGSITNIAFASGTDPNGGDVNSPNDDETVTAVQTPALSIVKTASPSTYDSVGDVISYSYLVSNDGNVTITSLAVTDDNVDASATCNDSTLAPQGSTTCSAQRTVTQTDIDAGSITNIAFASGTDPNGGDVNSPNDDETVTAVQTPALSIVKTASPSTYDSVGDVISYSYLVTNDGNVTITSLAVTDDNVDASATCNDSTLAPQGSTTCSAQRTVTQTDIDAGSITNIAFASGTDPNGGDVNSPNDDETVTAVQTPALSIVKTASPTTYDSVGDVIGYSYLVTNTGNVTITSLAVTDDNVDAAASCPTSTLAPQASTTCTAQRTVAQTDLDAGSITNVAFASGTDPNGGDVNSPNDDETVDAIQDPALVLVKSGTFNDENDDSFADAGETISYSFTVTNTGNVTLTDVSITDPGVTISGGPIASLAPSASDSSTFTGSYTITQADVDAGSFYNLATACADDPNSAETCDDDDHNEPLPQNPVMSISKSPDEQTIAQGTAASFTIVVSNDGNVTLTNVTVSDPLAPECDRVFASIAVGASEEYSCVATNVTTDFTNVATADSAETGPVSDTANVTVIPIVEFCEDNAPPAALLMQYSGTDSSVYIIVEHTQDGVIFADTVSDGGTFILEREDDGGNVKLNPELDVYVYDSEGGSLIDRIDIHTSCSLPLYAGQMFGTNLGTAKVTLLGEVDFGGDAGAIEPSDILWRNASSGENQLYEMNGFDIVSILGIQTVSNLDWQIVGRGDYNGGGSLDILWRNQATGQNWMYLMNGDDLILSKEVSKVTDFNWEIVGNGDYNGDGKSDILWRNAVNGQNWMYLMNGASIMASQEVNKVSNLNWQIVGSGDYNGDSRSDILWRNQVTGQNWVYLMNGASIMASENINVVSDIDWQIVGNGDYNGDGSSDILMRHATSGVNWLYVMDGSTILSSDGIDTVSDLNWEIVGDDDYDGDGKDDILWRNKVTGENVIYLMNGNVIKASQSVNTEADLNWKVIDTN